MKRRTLIAIPITLASCLMLGVAALHLYFNETRLRGMVMPPLEAAIGRRVEVDAIGLTVLTGLGASIDGLRISDRQEFGDGLFLSADRASIALSLGAALTGREGLGEMHIHGPNVYIVVNQRGVANYGDFVSGGSSEVAAPSVYLPIDRFRLRDGTITYADHRDDTQRAYRGVDYDLQLGADGPRISASGQLGIETVVTTAREITTTTEGGHLTHDLVFDLARAHISVRRIGLEVAGISIEANGKVEHLDAQPEIDLSIRHVTDRFETSAGPHQLSGRLDLDVAIEGRLAPEDAPPSFPAFHGRLAVRDLTATTADLVPLEHGLITARFDGASVLIDTLGVRAADSDLSVSGVVKGFREWLFSDGRPHLALQVRSSHIDLDQLMSAEPPASSTGFSLTTPAFATPPPVASPLPDLIRMFDLSGDLHLDRLTSGGTLTDVDATIRARRGVLNLDDIEGRLYGGTIEGRLILDAKESGSTLPLEGAINIDAASADGVLHNLFGLPLRLRGKMDLALNFAAPLDSTLTVLNDRITVRGSGEIVNGQVVNWGWLKRAAGSISQLSFMNFDHIPIRDLTSRFSVEEGRVKIENLSVVAADIPSRLRGSVGLDGALDFTLRMDIPPDKMNIVGINVGKALGSLFGRQPESIPITLNFGGTVDHPTVAVNTR